MSIANNIIPHYTYDDWVHWEGVWELIEGHPIAMSPTPVPSHQKIAAEIRTELILALRKAGCNRCRAYDPLDYKISEDTILVPDILIVCGEVKKKYLDFAPALIVEILSPATALRDRHTKYQLYEEQGVKYYLIVDIDQKQIEAFALNSGKYEILENQSYSFVLEEVCVIEPDFSRVFN